MSEFITDKQKKDMGFAEVFEVEPIRKMREFAPITFPNVCPERDLNVYLSSKIITNAQRAEPNLDNVPGAGVKLINRRIMLNIAEERLKKVRLIAKTQKDELKKEWEVVVKLQEQLRESMLIFDTFIKENMEKRERAEKKVCEELLLQGTRKENIELLVYQMRRLYEIKKIFESNIRAFRIYETYLQKVVGISEYKDVMKVMQRFSALQEAKETSFERGQQIMLLIEESMFSVKHTAEQNGFTIIGLKNKLCDLHIRFGKAQENALVWETTVMMVRDQCLKKYQDRSIVRQVCQGLYRLICNRKGLCKTTLLSSDYDHEYKMMTISKTLLQMEKIYKLVKDSISHDERITRSYNVAKKPSDSTRTTSMFSQVTLKSKQ